MMLVSVSWRVRCFSKRRAALYGILAVAICFSTGRTSSSFDRLKQWPVLRRGLSIHDELFVREPRRNAVGSCGAWTPHIAAVGKAENRADVSRYPATAGGLE